MLAAGVESDPLNWNVVVKAGPLAGDTVNAAVGAAKLPTTITVDAEPIAPLLSVAMTVKTYGPAAV